MQPLVPSQSSVHTSSFNMSSFPYNVPNVKPVKIDHLFQDFLLPPNTVGYRVQVQGAATLNISTAANINPLLMALALSAVSEDGQIAPFPITMPPSYFNPPASSSSSQNLSNVHPSSPERTPSPPEEARNQDQQQDPPPVTQRQQENLEAYQEAISNIINHVPVAPLAPIEQPTAHVAPNVQPQRNVQIMLTPVDAPFSRNTNSFAPVPPVSYVYSTINHDALRVLTTSSAPSASSLPRTAAPPGQKRLHQSSSGKPEKEERHHQSSSSKTERDQDGKKRKHKES
jgi:hypothetical protein